MRKPTTLSRNCTRMTKNDWETLYNDANFKHGVSRSVDEAVAWANELIASIAKA